MRIEDLYPPAIGSACAAGQVEKSAGEDRWSAGDCLDAVSLSRLSQILLASASQRARIEELRELLARGDYAVAPVAVSRRIVEFHLEAEADGQG